MKCLPLQQFVTMILYTEVISASSFNLLLFQVITYIYTEIVITKQYLCC